MFPGYFYFRGTPFLSRGPSRLSLPSWPSAAARSNKLETALRLDSKTSAFFHSISLVTVDVGVTNLRGRFFDQSLLNNKEVPIYKDFSGVFRFAGQQGNSGHQIPLD